MLLSGMEVVYKKAENEEEIKSWIEKNDGVPAMIDDPEVKQDEIGLRVDFPGQKDERMLSDGRQATRDISWDEFFALMKTHNLEFMYSDQEDIDLTWRYKFANKFEEPAQE